MVNNNLKPIENKKPFDTVYEIPSFEEFMKDYKADENLNYDDLKGGSVGEVGGHGPNPDGCSNERGGKRNQDLISALNSKKLGGKKFDWWDEDDSVYKDGDFRAHNFTTSSGASVGFGGAIAKGEIGYSAFRLNDGGSADAKFGNISAGGKAGIGAGGITAKAELGIDVANVNIKGFQTRVGVNFDTGGSIGDGGIEAKAGGFGFSVGKKTGLSTPLGEVAIDFEEACVVQ